ncbi:MAG: right-handed parallel beta-helix repeat-containing protein [Chloroflexota bacterium]
MSGSIIQFSVIEYAGGIETENNGAVRLEASTPYIDQSVIRQNGADGIHVWDQEGSVRVTNSEISGNASDDFMGADGIYIRGKGLVVLADNLISDNSGIGVNFPFSQRTEDVHDITIENNMITRNSMGGIYVSAKGAATISRNTVIENIAPLNGGGIYAWEGTIGDLVIEESIVANNSVTNSSSGNGGGIVASGGHIIDNTVLSNSSASDCGGIYAMRDTEVTRNTVKGNQAVKKGGGVCLIDGATAVRNTVADNQAGTNGGGIFVGVVNFAGGSVINNIVTNNAAAQGSGGGVYFCRVCRPVLTDNDICVNVANQGNAFYNANPSGAEDINAENNYWGSTDLGTIETQIWHFIDDSALGIVDYEPIRTAPVSSNADVCELSTPTPTLILTLTSTATSIATSSVLPTATPTPTPTPTSIDTSAPKNTSAISPTSTPDPTLTSTPTASSTNTLTPTHTPSNGFEPNNTCEQANPIAPDGAIQSTRFT